MDYLVRRTNELRSENRREGESDQVRFALVSEAIECYSDESKDRGWNFVEIDGPGLYMIRNGASHASRPG